MNSFAEHLKSHKRESTPLIRPSVTTTNDQQVKPTSEAKPPTQTAAEKLDSDASKPSKKADAKPAKIEENKPTPKPTKEPSKEDR